MSIVKLNNQAVKDATSFGSISSLGEMVFIKKLTASSSATLSFVDGTDGVTLDNTYKEYLFTFNNIHPSSNNIRFQFNLSTDNGSNYNVTKTSTYFKGFGDEGGTDVGLGYTAGQDLAQGTGFQTLAENCGNDNDQTISGTLTLFNPSSSVFVKHFISRFSNYEEANRMFDCFSAGYGNNTNPVDAVRFQMSSGNIDAGDICLYGIA